MQAINILWLQFSSPVYFFPYLYSIPFEATGNEGNQKENDKNVKEDFGDAGSTGGDTGKTK